MAGRSKKRAGKRSSNASTGEVDEQTAVKRGGTVQAIRTWNDVEHDSDEDFDDSRDKVLLDYDRRTARRSGGNDDSGSESDGEVFGVTAADSDDQSDGESDGSGGNFFADSDDGDNDRDARLDDGAWGKQRENYYFADDMGEDSADDDAAFAEEAEEALRLQKRQLEALDEDDFIDALGAQLGAGSTAASSAAARLVTAVDDGQAQLDLDGVRLDGTCDMSEAKRRALLALAEPQRLRIVQAESPELVALVADFAAYWHAVRSEVRPVLERAAALGVGADEHPALAFYAAKYQLLMGYVNNVAVYLVLKASPAELRGGELRAHPVIAALVEFRRRIEAMAALQQRLAPLLALFADELRTGTVGAAAAAAGAAAEPSAAQSGSDAEMAEPTPRRAPRKTRKRTTRLAPTAAPFLAAGEAGEDSYAALQKSLRRAASRAPASAQPAARDWDALDDGDFGEHERLDTDDAEDKARAVRRLRHHAKRIAQAQTKRAARGKLSGDADVAYKPSRAAALQRVDDRAAAAIRQQAGAFGDDLAMDVDADGSASDAAASDADADAYYREVAEGAARQRAAKDARRQDQWRMMVAANVAEEAAVDGAAKRGVNYQILKNKGLMPRRTKEQRNPRVKRRMRFEKAKKKLGSAVVQARVPASSYGGEATGIKTALSRSTRFK